MLKKIINKKGEDLLVDFWAIVLFALFLLIVLVIIILNKDTMKTQEVQKNFINNDLNYMLNSYLKSPSLIDKDKTNAEIIVEDYLNKDYTNTEKSFELFFSGVNITNNNLLISCTLKISDGIHLKIITHFLNQINLLSTHNYEYAKTKIPTMNKDLDISLSCLYKITNDEFK